MSAAASSLEANSVVPSLCWDSRWPPRWTVYMLAGQAACAELHTSPSTCCLSFSHAVCCDTDLLAIIHLCFLYSFDCHLCPTKRHHILHHPCQELPSTVFVHCCKAPTSPDIPIHAVITSVVCDFGLSLTPGDAECLRFLFHPQKEEWWSDIPSSYNAASPSFQEPVQNCSPWICSWLPNRLCLFITTAALSAYLTPAFSLSRAFSCAAFYHLESPLDQLQFLFT